MRHTPSQLVTLLYRLDFFAWRKKSQFPRSYGCEMLRIRTFFYTKMHFFLKKFAYVHFL